MNQVSN